MGAAFDGRTNGVALFVALNVAHSCPYPGGRIPAICLGAVWLCLVRVVDIGIVAAQPPHREVVAITKPRALVSVQRRGLRRRIRSVVRVTAAALLVRRERVVCAVALGRWIAPALCPAVRPRCSAWARLGSSLTKHRQHSSEQPRTSLLPTTCSQGTAGCTSNEVQLARHVRDDDQRAHVSLRQQSAVPTKKMKNNIQPLSKMAPRCVCGSGVTAPYR